MSKQEIKKRLNECENEYYRCSRMINEHLSEDGHEIDIMESLEYEMQHLRYLLKKEA